jgi:trigger factor
VSLNREDLISYIKITEKNLAKRLDIKGFRPGKATEDVVRKEIGEEKIKQEALELAISSSLSEILEKENLDVLEQKDLKIKKNSAESLVFEVLVLFFPKVTLGQYKGIALKKNPVSVTDSEVDEVLNSIAKSKSVLTETKEPAKKGDKIEIDFEVKDNGILIDGGKSENHPAVIGEGKFVPGFEEQIIGMKTGDDKKFSLKIPADYYQKSIAGKQLDFEVRLKKVENVATPEINDDFVKTLGNFSSLQVLKNSIKHSLILEKETKEKEKARLEIIEKITKDSKLELPAFLVERQLDDMIGDLDSELHQKGMELALYLAHIKKTQDDLRKEWRVRAEEQVKKILVARAIIKAEKIKVSEEELNAGVEEVLQKYIASGQAGSEKDILENIDPERLKNNIHNSLVNEKMFEFLEKEAKPAS